MYVIRGAGVIAVRFYGSEHGLRCTEERQCLIDEMRPQVEQQAASPRCFLAPALRHFRPEAIEMRLVMRHTSKPAAFDQRTHRHEIAVPAAAVGGAEKHSAAVSPIGA